MAAYKLSKKKKKEIESFLIERFRYLRERRDEIDTQVDKEVEMYNNIDRNVQSKNAWEEKYEIPYTYIVVQTIVARLINSLFGSQNYLKLFLEDPEFKVELQDLLTKWLQDELDKIKFKERARDFLEAATVKRLAWLQLHAVNVKKEGKKLKPEFDILDYYDVWFDLKAKTVMDSDFFVRKLKRLWEIKSKPNVYFNLDKVSRWVDDSTEDIDENYRKNQIGYKNSGKDDSEETSPTYESFDQHNNVTDEVEILEYYGLYDMSDENVMDPKYSGEGVEEVIFTLANRTTLIRAEKNTTPFKRKRLLFPIRPLKQANSLTGKGVPQLTISMAQELNETRSLRMHNMKLLAKLLFKYNKNSDIDLAEIFAKGGNAIGYEGWDERNSIEVFNIPNVIRDLSLVANDIANDIQVTTGAMDPIIGQDAAETAAATRSLTEQAMFKFEMMAENVYHDIIDFINYLGLLYIKFSPNEVLLKYPEFENLFNKDIKELEKNYIFDLELRDNSQRRDVERNQWANMLGIFFPMVQQSGGNVQELLKQFMAAFQIPNWKTILQAESPEALAAKLIQNPALAQKVLELFMAARQAEETKGGGANAQVQQAEGVKGGDTLEVAANENLAER